MASKNISIRQDVYEYLKTLQRDGESFSEEIMRLTSGYRNDFSDLIGLEIDVDWDELRRDRKKSMGDNRRARLLA